MKNKISKAFGLISSASAIGISVLPLISLAQITGPSQPALPPNNPVTFGTLSSALCTAVGWIFTLLIILVVIFVLFAAYNYLTSGGEEEKIKEANHQLLYAAIALIVAILSRGVPYLVGTFLGPNSISAGCT